MTDIGQIEWRARSGAAGGEEAVEVARVGDEFWVRNRKFPDTILKYTRAEWDAFVAGANNNEFRF